MSKLTNPTKIKNPNRDQAGRFACGPEGKPLPEAVKARKRELSRLHRQNDLAFLEAERKRLRMYHYVRNYRMTFVEVTALRLAQGNRCACCRRQFPDNPRNQDVNVDHDHETGRVRGILCAVCNRSIGGLGDTLDGVLRAARYLGWRDAEHIEEHW